MTDMWHIAKVLEKVAPENWDSCGLTYESIVWKDASKAIAESIINEEHDLIVAAEPIRGLRLRRNVLLAETDWMAFKDVTLPAAWKTYRQALRDLPASANPTLDENGQLTNITWPTKPE